MGGTIVFRCFSEENFVCLYNVGVANLSLGKKLLFLLKNSGQGVFCSVPDGIGKINVL